MLSCFPVCSYYVFSWLMIHIDATPKEKQCNRNYIYHHKRQGSKCLKEHFTSIPISALGLRWQFCFYCTKFISFWNICFCTIGLPGLYPSSRIALDIVRLALQSLKCCSYLKIFWFHHYSYWLRFTSRSHVWHDHFHK